MNKQHCRALTFLCVAGAYAGVATSLFAAWEIAQLPLYTIWRERSFAQNIAAALHCTLGDAVIAFLAFLAAVWMAFLLGFRSRPGTIGTIAVAGVSFSAPTRASALDSPLAGLSLACRSS